MTNGQIYRKTLGFSLRRVFWDIVALVILAAITVGGFMLANNFSEGGAIGLLIGFIVGLIVVGIVLRFVSYRLKAGQIAMMTKGVTEGKLPDNVIKAGKQVVKERFATVAAYFAITGAIKGIFNQVGRGITKLGEKIGGNTGSTVGSAISSAIQTLVSYLCDCCLGWVFYRKDQSAVKATCDGAVLFFKHGKTLAKNMGRVAGIGLLSLLLIGGVFAGILYVVLSNFPQLFVRLSQVLAESATSGEGELPAFLLEPQNLMIACCVLGALILWSMVHSVFVKPYILVGVLRNYVKSGIEDMPAETEYSKLDQISPKFRKLHNQLA